MSISRLPIVSSSVEDGVCVLSADRSPGIVYEEALATTSLVRPYLARALLGWQPRKTGLVDGLETYYAAYLASRN
jgi:hypothetical protein